MNPTELKTFCCNVKREEKNCFISGIFKFYGVLFFLNYIKFNYNHIIHSRYMYYQKYGKQFSHFFAKLLTGAVVKIFAGT